MRYLVALFTFISLTVSANNSALLLSNSKELNSVAKELLADTLNLLNTSVESNFEQKQIITGEGYKIDFNDIFTNNSLRDDKSIKRLYDEYQPEVIALVFSESEKSTEYKGYGLNRTKYKFRVKVLDAVNGRTIFNKSLSHQTKFRSDSDDEDKKSDAKKAAYEKAFAEFKVSSITEAINDINLASGAGNKFIIVVKDVNPVDVFPWTEETSRVIAASGSENIRDTFDRGNNEIIFRGSSKSDLRSFLSTFYKKSVESDLLSSFEIVTLDNRVELTKRDPDSLRIVINNIAPSDYRTIGAAMDNIVKSLGVKELKKSYNKEEFELSYSFISTIEPVDFDTRLWAKITADSTLTKIVQDSTSGNTLGYFFNGDKIESRSLVVTVNDVDEKTYATSGRMLITTVKQIEGVSKFKYDYSESSQTINMTFRYSGENAYAIDSVIWDRIENNRLLGNLKAGMIDEDSLEYFFAGDDRNAKKSDRIIISIKGVSGRDYKNVSTSFNKILKSISRVGNVRYGYSAKKKIITFKVNYSGDGLFELEDKIQLALTKSETLGDIRRGDDKNGRIIYHFSDDDNDDYVETSSSSSTNNVSSSKLEKLEKTVVLIINYAEKGGNEGTGFFVSNDGYVLTNEHVVAGGGILYVKNSDGDKWKATLIEKNAEQDLALIKLNTTKKNFPAAKIGNSKKVRKGDPITMIGNPLGSEYHHSIATGIISGLNRDGGSFQMSVPTYPGNSGSPIFDKNGRVIAVARAVAVDAVERTFKVEKENFKATTYDAANHIGLAVPISYAKSLLSMTK